MFKKIVITGATSMLGLALINECIKNDVFVFAVIRKNSLKRKLIPEDQHVKIIESNIDNFENLSFYEDGFDCFYHFMWSGTSGKERNNIIIQEQNVNYATDAIKCAKINNCKKFIGVGSQAEYGLCNTKINEHTETNPISEYGKAKLEAGMKCRDYSIKNGLQFNWVRVFSVYGENDRKNTLISTLIDSLRNGDEIKLTKCEQNWDYLYSEDAGRGLLLIGEKGKNNKTYNLGYGVSRPLKEYVEIIKNKINKNAIIKYGVIPYQENQTMNLEVDISDLKRDTEWKPMIGFEEGIERIINNNKNEKEK